jgi:ribosomal protein L37AE/L43A
MANETLNQMAANECRACSNKRGNKETATRGVYTCAACGAIFGTCYLGDSYGFVLPRMSSAAVSPEDQKYFDFTTLGSAGLGRRHGWFDPTSKLITQVG